MVKYLPMTTPAGHPAEFAFDDLRLRPDDWSQHSFAEAFVHDDFTGDLISITEHPPLMLRLEDFLPVDSGAGAPERASEPRSVRIVLSAASRAARDLGTPLFDEPVAFARTALPESMRIPSYLRDQIRAMHARGKPLHEIAETAVTAENRFVPPERLAAFLRGNENASDDEEPKRARSTPSPESQTTTFTRRGKRRRTEQTLPARGAS